MQAEIKTPGTKEIVLVVDDEPEVLELISEHLIGRNFSVQRAATLEDALAQLKDSKFDLVIADIFLGAERLGGIKLLKEINTAQTPCILISGNASVESLREAVNLGASYFLEKPFELSDLEGISRNLIKSGGSDVDRRISELASERRLTPREDEVVRLLSKGMSNREIADSVSTSERTVKAHISSIFKKCDVSSRAELLSLLIA